jgi:nucleolar protein 14
MKTKKGNNKKLSKSELICKRKNKVAEKRDNPFELHINREKFDIMNRKRSHSLGQPLISRQKSFDKRKELIGGEYKIKHKSNSFQDNRKAGFRKLPKESIYNLSDNLELTHRGQTLKEIGQFEDVPEDFYMSDEDEPRLNGKIH